MDMLKISRIKQLESLQLKIQLIFTMTAAMKDEISSRGVHPKKITLIPNCASPGGTHSINRAKNKDDCFTFDI